MPPGEATWRIGRFRKSPFLLKTRSATLPGVPPGTPRRRPSGIAGLLSAFGSGARTPRCNPPPGTDRSPGPTFRPGGPAPRRPRDAPACEGTGPRRARLRPGPPLLRSLLLGLLRRDQALGPFQRVLDMAFRPDLDLPPPQLGGQFHVLSPFPDGQEELLLGNDDLHRLVGLVHQDPYDLRGLQSVAHDLGGVPA